jgi:hypothetical protein
MTTVKDVCASAMDLNECPYGESAGGCYCKVLGNETAAASE